MTHAVSEEPQETDVETIKADLIAAWDLADKDIHTKVDFALDKLAELWHEVKGDAEEVVATDTANPEQPNVPVTDSGNQSTVVPPQP